ncbi:MAG: efflux RND transporter periplasmic adaptor subunit [Thermoanaerobaculia bacterium]
MKRAAYLILLLTVGWTATGCGGRHEERAAPSPQPIAVRLAVAERVAGDRRIELAGTVAAERSAAVSSRVMALVTAVHVQLGDEVRAGQALVSIDPATADGQAAEARGALAQAEAALTLAARNRERFEALAKSGSASALEVETARMQHEQAQGAVEQARGAVAAARSVAGESRVVAPFAGRVAERSVEAGDLAMPGRPLARIDSATGRRLVIALPESLAHAAALAPGSPVAVRLDARGDLGELAGRVVEISPGPDPAAHSFTVKIDLPGVAVATGAAGRAYLPDGTREAVRLPREALVESGGLDLVVVRDADGRAESRVVTVGATGADGRVEILSGLAGGESVVLGLPVAPVTGTPLEVLP